MKAFFKAPANVVVVGLSAVLLAPLLFTMSSKWGLFDFTETGQIGDTIG